MNELEQLREEVANLRVELTLAFEVIHKTLGILHAHQAVLQEVTQAMLLREVSGK